MSKSDEAYMRLEEQAQALGFQDVGDACAHGYDIVCMQLVEGTELAMRNAKKQWEEHRKKLCEALVAIAQKNQSKNWNDYVVLVDAVDFLNEECTCKF